jgi:hypothetical protein
MINCISPINQSNSLVLLLLLKITYSSSIFLTISRFYIECLWCFHGTSLYGWHIRLVDDMVLEVPIRGDVEQRASYSKFHESQPSGVYTCWPNVRMTQWLTNIHSGVGFLTTPTHRRKYLGIHTIIICRIYHQLRVLGYAISPSPSCTHFTKWSKAADVVMYVSL